MAVDLDGFAHGSLQSPRAEEAHVPRRFRRRAIIAPVRVGGHADTVAPCNNA
jgi:hypothetical protein